jgi:uncharacterized protein YceK
MKTRKFGTRNILLVWTILASVLLGGCSRFSESIRDSDAGMNGSFEVTESGLPVNWRSRPVTWCMGDTASASFSSF